MHGRGLDSRFMKDLGKKKLNAADPNRSEVDVNGETANVTSGTAHIISWFSFKRQKYIV